LSKKTNNAQYRIFCSEIAIAKHLAGGTPAFPGRHESKKYAALGGAAVPGALKMSIVNRQS
jgi:hypothetical protein